MSDNFVWDGFPKHPMVEMIEIMRSFKVFFFFSLPFTNVTTFFIKILNWK